MDRYAVDVESGDGGYYVRRAWYECGAGRFSCVEYLTTGGTWKAGRAGRLYRKAYKTRTGAERAAERVTR